MFKSFKLLLIILFASSGVFAQTDISLEDIWNSKFHTESIDEIHPMKNGEYFTVLKHNNNSSSIQKYQFSDFTKVNTIVNGLDIKNHSVFNKYQFSPNEKSVLLATEYNNIYRHSYLAKHILYNLENRTLIFLSKQKEQEPSFSPNGKKIAFVANNNIYIKNLTDSLTTKITSDGKTNSIINGVTDWVYEEEFAFVKAYEWSANGKYIAYLKFNETDVPEISMDIFSNSLYPKQLKYKYPKAGEKNSIVSLYIYNTIDSTTTKVKASELNEFYIPRIKWTNKSGVLSFTILNRHQNNLELKTVDASSMEVKTLLTEKSNTYVEADNNLTFLADNSFIITSDKSGYNHIYQYSKDGVLIKQITQEDEKNKWEVTELYGVDENKKTIYYQSTELGSINRGIYSIKINGKRKKELSDKAGINSANFSSNFRYYINNYSEANTPNVITLNDAKDGDIRKTIVNNNELNSTLKKYNLPKKKFITLRNKKGKELNAWVIKPTDFVPTKKYPVFMYVYGGPGSQTVKNNWNSYNDMWFRMLANSGYIVVSVDNTGTGGKGAEFKKATYKQLGKLEIEDQIDAAKYFGSLPYIDKSRIGMFGWSFGGYMTSLAMTKGADIFKMGIAVAPVTNWRFYDTVYTERYMQTPEENYTGYDDNSPINYVEKLKGKYLLIHGSADDNVHYQNTMLMINAIVNANKQFDLFIYPDKNHGIYGGNTRLHLYTKMTNYIKTNL
ncbi:MAG: S9 family peptidase [Ichthyobacteriaceae bacterium]|nr:S9 family peptidase [Ichthyobacteriaceae bacterium]